MDKNKGKSSKLTFFLFLHNVFHPFKNTNATVSASLNLSSQTDLSFEETKTKKKRNHWYRVKNILRLFLQDFLNLNVTQLLIGLAVRVNQSEVVLHSNAAKYRKIELNVVLLLPDSFGHLEKNMENKT